MEVSVYPHAPAALPLRKDPWYPIKGDWVGLRADLIFLEKRKFLASAGIRTPDRPARSLVTVPTETFRFVGCLISFGKLQIVFH